MPTPRQIYVVHASVVDANGAFNLLNGYPKTFDSKLYDNDIDKARQRAFGEYHEVLGAMCRRDDRQLQLAMIIRISDGIVLAKEVVGRLAEVEAE